MLTLSFRAFKRLPIEAAVIPFPRPESTPPVTKIYLVGFFATPHPYLFYNLYATLTPCRMQGESSNINAQFRLIFLKTLRQRCKFACVFCSGYSYFFSSFGNFLGQFARQIRP